MEHPIYIIGAGAIGKTLAVALKLNNKNVILLRGSVDDGTRSLEKIEVLLPEGKTPLKAEIEISTPSHYTSLDGLIVLTTKSYGNEQLAQALRPKTGSSPVVILQNGLSVEQGFIDHNFPEVYRCVLFTTSQVVSQQQVRYKPVAVSPIGVIKGNLTTLNRLVNELHTDALPFRVEHDIQPIIWKKAIINCAFNSICPLLEADNGIFHRNESALNLARTVIAEGSTIAAAQGITLDRTEIEQTLLQISRSSDGQLISTYQDILAKRRTEIDTLNIEIARIAKALEKDDTVNTIRLLGELTRMKSQITQQPQT